MRKEKWKSGLTLCDPMDYTWNSPGQNTGVGSLSLLQGIFLTQGSNPGRISHCRRVLYQVSHKGRPRILEWVANPFSRGSSRPKNRTGVSCIAGGFFTNWAIRKALHTHTHTHTHTHMHVCNLVEKILGYKNKIHLLNFPSWLLSCNKTDFVCIIMSPWNWFITATTNSWILKDVSWVTKVLFKLFKILAH